MKIFTLTAKWFIDFFGFIIRRNKSAIKYLFSVTLKEQVVDYVENQYFKGYIHIDRAIYLYKTLPLPVELIIIDAGGGTGETAAIFHKQIPNSKIYIFEPIPGNFQVLENRFQNNTSIILNNIALGNFKGKSTIHIANRVTSSSIFELKPSDSESIFDKHLTPVSDEEIFVDKLDNLFNDKINIGILKLDVQGYELEVLKGAQKCMDNIYIIIVEVNNHSYYNNAPGYYDVDVFLRKNDFTISNIFPNLIIKGKLMEWDVIYINNKCQ